MRRRWRDGTIKSTIKKAFFWVSHQKLNKMTQKKRFKNGAENETRTRDPQLGKLMLYQLSYFRVNTVAKIPDNLFSTEIFLAAPLPSPNTNNLHFRASQCRIIPAFDALCFEQFYFCFRFICCGDAFHDVGSALAATRAGTFGMPD